MRPSNDELSLQPGCPAPPAPDCASLHPGYSLAPAPPRPRPGARMSARIIVVPPSAETGEIARELAPAGFELVLVRGDRAELEAALGEAEYVVCYPSVTMKDAVLSRGAAAAAGAAAERRLRQRRSRGGAARQGAGRQQRRRQRDLGRRARADADAHGVAPADLDACQRGGRALARQRAGAAHVRAVRQDARHRRARHHRQEGGAAGARVRHAGRVLRHRAAERGRRGRARRALPAAARAAATLRRHLAARAAQRFDPPHDRRGRARADEARGDPDQHLPRAGGGRGGARTARSPTARCSAPGSTCSTRSRRRPTIRCSSSTTWC